MLQNFISEYGTMILYAVLTAIFGYLGTRVKGIYEKYINTKLKESIVEYTCKYVEQIYSALSGEEKLQKALEAACEMLAEKGITISELELRVLIEASVNSFKSGLVEGEVE